MKRTEADKQFFQIMGEIVVLYSYSEVLCSLIVNHITNSLNGNKIFSNVKFNSDQKIQGYESAVIKSKHECKTRFLWALSDLNQCRLDRNTIVHTSWHSAREEWHGFGIKKSDGKLTYSTTTDAKGLLKRLTNLHSDILIIFGDTILADQKKITL